MFGFISIRATLIQALLAQPGSERTGEVSLKNAEIPASDLDALQEDRIQVSLVVQDMQGNVTEAVEANTPITLRATIDVDVVDGMSDFCIFSGTLR